MALTSTKLIHTNSSTPGAAPTTGQITQGQIAINSADKKIFIKDAANNIIAVASAAALAAALSAAQSVNGQFPISGDVTLTPSNIGTYGVAALDANSKISTANLPDSILGGVIYQGTYDATTDSPALPAATTNKGNYWVVSAAGTQHGLTLTVGDWILSNGTIYEKVDAQDTISSVNGKTGTVVLNAADVGALALTGGGSVGGAVSFTGTLVVPTPTLGTQAANKDYVDTAIASIPASGGTVTSVNVTSSTSIITATGGPVTTSGAIALDLATQAQALVLAGPASGADAKPTFRALAATDIPVLDEGTYA